MPIRRFKEVMFLSWIVLLSAVLISACSGKESAKGDLSFGGITIGKEFPDSLKKTFENYDYPGPSYSGTVSFTFPESKQKDLHVDANCNMAGSEVICISVYLYDLGDAIDMYNMLRSRYGIPKSDYGDADCGLQTLMHRVYDSLGYYGMDEVNVTGDRVIASWSPTGYKSDILFIANTYQSNSYGSTPSTKYMLRYVDRIELNKALEEYEKKKELDAREDYRNKNQESMNQDF